MTIRRRVRHRSIIPTASMADIAMLLLIFFMSTSIVRSQDSLDVRLPGTTTGDRIRTESAIRVSLSESGAVAFNDARVELEAVGAILSEKLRRNPKLTILLHADGRAPYETVALLVEQLKLARAPRVSLLGSRKALP